MISPTPLILLLVSTIIPHAPAVEPLSKAAAKIAAISFEQQKLPGCIITAETTGSNPASIAIQGNPPFPNNPPGEVLFEIGSLTKVFTALLLSQAVVEGKTTLDTTITRCLGVQQHFSDPRVANITLKQLATHTSGLPRLPPNLYPTSNPSNPYQHYHRDLLCTALQQIKLTSDGPHPQQYSNFAYGVLGEVLACLYNKSWGELVHEKIISPLGMKNTVIDLTPAQQSRFAPPYRETQPTQPWQLNALAGAGALRSTADDLLLFCKALLHPQSTPFPQAIELLTTPQTSSGTLALGLHIGKLNQQTFLEHHGATGGHRSSLRIYPQRSHIQIILTNNHSINPESIYSQTDNLSPD